MNEVISAFGKKLFENIKDIFPKCATVDYVCIKELDYICRVMWKVNDNRTLDNTILIKIPLETLKTFGNSPSTEQKKIKERFDYLIKLKLKEFNSKYTIDTDIKPAGTNLFIPIEQWEIAAEIMQD